MENSSHLGQRIAALLLDSGCVTMRVDEPFRLPSGWASPAYVDCRRVIAYPQACAQILTLGIDVLREAGALDDVDGIVGCEASGIAFAAWIAQKFELPLHYVRKKPIGGKQIEGNLQAGQRVILVDDMMAGGTSKRNFARAIQAAGAHLTHALVVFDYGTFQAKERLWTLGLQTHELATWQDVLQVASQRKLFDTHSLDELAEFLSNPSDWSYRHGGLSSWPPSSE